MENKKVKAIIVIVIIILSITIYNSISFIKNKTNNNYSEIIVSNGLENTVNTLTNDVDANSTEVQKKNLIKVYVTGEVNNPGIIEIEEGDRIADAIEKAGGSTDMADLQSVNLAYCLEDGQKLYIPSKEEKVEEYLSTENGEGVVETTNSATSNEKININKASEEELQKISGVGPAMAKKIVEYRNQNGNFKTIEDLKNVNRNW